MTAQDRIAEELWEHDWDITDMGGRRCLCGRVLKWYGDRDKGMAKHRAEVLDALPGIAIVELPEPNMDGLADWWPDDDVSPWSVSVFDGHPRIDFDSADDDSVPWRERTGLQVSAHNDEHWPFIHLTRERARMLAAHLLAAARAAGGES